MELEEKELEEKEIKGTGKIKVDGKTIKLYSLDNETSIRERTSLLFNTLPEFIFTKDINLLDIIKDLSKSYVIKINNVEDYIKANKDENIETLYKNVVAKWNIVNETFIYLYYKYNKEELEDENFAYSVEFEFKNIGIDVDLKNIKIKFRDFESLLKQNLETIKQNVASFLKLVKFEEEGKKLDFEITPFNIEETSFSLIIEDLNLSIYSIFDKILPNEDVPFINLYGKFIKAKLYSFISTEWLRIKEEFFTKKKKDIEKRKKKSDKDFFSDEFIEIKIYDKNKGLNRDNPNAYTTFYFIPNENKIIYNLIKGQDDRNILSILLNLGLNIKIKNKIQIFVSGFFKISNIKNFNIDIFNYLVTNEESYSIIFFNELYKLMNLKKSFTFFYNYEPDIKIPINLKYTSTSLTLNIKYAKDIIIVEKFINIFIKLLYIYDNKYEGIKKFYSNIIPSFLGEGIIKKEKEKEKEKKELKAIFVLKKKAPDIFVNKYAREVCQSKAYPTIIDENEKDKYKDRQIMAFPIKGEGEVKYFTCLHDRYKYIGLKRNDPKLSNYEKYKYLPCCYPDNQIDKPSEYNDYFFPEKFKEHKPISTGYLIKSMKILKYREFGEIKSKNILDFFEPFGEKINRYGNVLGNNSFISVVMFVFDQTFSKIKEVKKIDEYIQDKKVDIINKVKLNICKQEAYKYSTNELFNIWQSSGYIDSKIFRRLLEEYFNVNIFIFEINEKYPDGSLELPNYRDYYVIPERLIYDKSIIIIKHFGIQKDNLSLPHYELLIFDQERLILNKEEEKELFNCFKLMINSFSFTSFIPKEVDIDKLGIPNKYLSYITKQFITNRGKVRVLEINIERKIYYILENEIYPLNKDILDLKDIKLPDINYVLSFLKEQNIDIDNIYQYIRNDKTLGLYILDKFYIPCLPSSPIKLKTTKMKEFFHTIVFEKKQSLLNMEYETRKLAHIIEQYCYYYFSIYLNNIFKDIKKVLMIDKDYKKILIDNFLDSKTMVKKHIYILENISDKFNDSNIYENNKIILYTEDLKNRLNYILLNSSFTNIYKYFKNNRYIPEFYTTFKDFKQGEDYKVLSSLDMIKYMTNVYYFSILDDLSYLNVKTIYPLIFIYKNKKYIVQNVINGDIKRVFNICDVWNKEKRNIGYYAEPILIYTSIRIFEVMKDIKINELIYEDKEIEFNIIKKDKYYSAMLNI